jgi:hypothetical protein
MFIGGRTSLYERTRAFSGSKIAVASLLATVTG